MSLPPAAELERDAAELLRQWRVADTNIRVFWNDRLTTTAGRAFVKLGSVELNPTLLRRAPDQLRVVLTHEVAHIAAARLFGANIAAHGRHWRSLMAHAGLPPDITHKIPVPNVRGRRGRFFYLRICDACGDRRIAGTVRYGRCHGCEARDGFLVMKAPATAAGRSALQKLSLTDVRAQCIMARP